MFHPIIYMTYIFFLSKYSRRSWWSEFIEVFWKDYSNEIIPAPLYTFVNEIKIEMIAECRRKRWYEGEMSWKKVTANDLISFLRKYDARRINAERKTKKNKSYKRRSPGNQRS
jgi:hypothetical protein